MKHLSINLVIIRLLIVGIPLPLAFSCASDGDNYSNEEAYGDADSDSDTDMDTDVDSDSDADSNSDSDTDADTDVDSDSDADSDSDTDVDTDADSDSDADSDTDVDTDVDSDSDTDSDTITQPVLCTYECRTANWCSNKDGVLISHMYCTDVDAVCCDPDGVSDTDSTVDTEDETDIVIDTDPDSDTDTDVDGCIEEILSESMFNAMFPDRNSFYTYNDLIAATSAYPAFACTGDLETKKREVAAFLANVAWETGGLEHIEELNHWDYCDSSPWFCSCASGKQYYGRGPLQISWNYNYCYAGEALGYDLQNNPDLVAQDATVAWATALWFWMTQTGAGTYDCHTVMVNDYGFGETIETINGALECNGGYPTGVDGRIEYYTDFCSVLGVSTGSNLDC